MDTTIAFHTNKLNININIQGTKEKPLFRATEVGTILDIKNIRTSTQEFDETEKCGVCTMDAIGREQVTTFLTEKGLYKILFKSRKPIAKQFTDWVCEVMTEIRLNGKYELEKQLEIKDNEILTIRERTMISDFDRKKVVYMALVEENVIKFGYSDNIKDRVNTHKKEIGPQFSIQYIIETNFNREVENLIKQKLKNKIFAKVYLDKKQTELIQLDNEFTIFQLYSHIIDFKDTYNNSEMVTKLLEENETLKKQLSTSIEENDTLKKQLNINVEKITTDHETLKQQVN